MKGKGEWNFGLNLITDVLQTGDDALANNSWKNKQTYSKFK